MISSTDLKTLRAELTGAGLFEHRTAATWAKLVLLLIGFSALIVAALMLPWWWCFLLAPLAAIPAVSLAMIAHEAAHGSFSGSQRHNQIVLHLVFPMFGGLSALHWKNKHNHLHHGHPNIEGRDPDLEIWPMALSRATYDESNAFRRWFQRRAQAYMFWPLTLFLAFSMRLASLRHLRGRIRAKGIDREVALDVGCLVAHYTLWLVVPSIWLGVLPVLAFYAGIWAVGGLLLGLIFAPAHIGLPVVLDQDNPWLHQLTSTRNFHMSRALSWFFVGLDFQVEHHMFPRIPHQHLPRASAIARTWCARLGVPHQSIPYAAGVADVTRYLRRSWDDVPGEPPVSARVAGRALASIATPERTMLAPR